MDLLGIKEENLYFLDLAESRRKRMPTTERKLRTILQEISRFHFYAIRPRSASGSSG
jgi:hypothetical protein